VISLPTLSKGKHKIHAKYFGSALVTKVVGKTITLTVTAK
jgi:hypothetical protein